MRTRTLPLVLLLTACGSTPTQGPERDETVVATDTDAGSPGDVPNSDADPGDAPVADVPRPDVNPADVRPSDVPGRDVPTPDAPMLDVGPDAPDDIDPDLVPDVFDTPPSPDAEEDPIDDARPDAEPDPDVEPDIAPLCDEDGDGYIAEACGGDDCDDGNTAVHPDRAEACNFHDDNCNGEVNEDLDCRVYAHTSSQLYLVDPFLGTDDFVTSVPGLFDFDTDSGGGLYGISNSRVLHVFDEVSDAWSRVGTFATTAGNGFAIDSDRIGYITAGNNLYTIDIDTAVATLVGSMGGGFSSSGDCVVDKSDQLFMTSIGPGQDRLVAVSRSTGEARLVGNTGFSGIWGLTAAWGHLFGFTSSGQVVELDPGTGAGVLVHTIAGRSWYGAASSPGR